MRSDHRVCYLVGVLGSALRGIITLSLVIINTALWCVLLYVPGLARMLVPLESARQALGRLLIRLAQMWIAGNNAVLDLVHNIEWDVRGVDGLRLDRTYLVTCNHQTWADIPVLQRTFNHRAPFIRFFLKQELIWVPLLGLAWWFLDYPFMKRYSRQELERRPELRGKDLETARRACEKFRSTPASILNFLEGTRFTTAKHRSQESPYLHLLRPKAGGMAFVIDAMGDSLHSLLDVTIVYPSGAPNFREFLAGGLDRVIVHVEERQIPAELQGGDYLGDAVLRQRFQKWVHNLWQQKDDRITSLLAEARHAADSKKGG